MAPPSPPPEQGRQREREREALSRPVRVVAHNRRATYDLDIRRRLEAGLALQGWEAKSLRAGRASALNAHVRVRRGQAWLVGLHIEPLPQSASMQPPPDPTRQRKLLLRAGQIRALERDLAEKGTACVLVRLLFRGQNAKAEVGVGRGRKRHDKRRREAERDWQRDKAKLRSLRG